MNRTNYIKSTHIGTREEASQKQPHLRAGRASVLSALTQVARALSLQLREGGRDDGPIRATLAESDLSLSLSHTHTGLLHREREEQVAANRETPAAAAARQSASGFYTARVYIHVREYNLMLDWRKRSVCNTRLCSRARGVTSLSLSLSPSLSIARSVIIESIRVARLSRLRLRCTGWLSRVCTYVCVS